MRRLIGYRGQKNPICSDGLGTLQASYLAFEVATNEVDPISADTDKHS